MSEVALAAQRWKVIGKFVVSIPLLCLGLASYAETTPTDSMRALKGLKAIGLETVRTPIYDSSGCAADERMLRSLAETHAERSGLRIAGPDENELPTLTISVLHFRVKHTNDCTASVDMTLTTVAEYNDANLPLIIWSSQALMTVNKEDLSRKVHEQADRMLYIFFAFWRNANR